MANAHRIARQINKIEFCTLGNRHRQRVASIDDDMDGFGIIQFHQSRQQAVGIGGYTAAGRSIPAGINGKWGEQKIPFDTNTECSLAAVLGSCFAYVIQKVAFGEMLLPDKPPI